MTHPRELGPCPNPRHWGPRPDPRELGPDARPKKLRFGRMTHSANGFVGFRSKLKRIGFVGIEFVSGPKRLGSGCTIQESWVRTTNPRELVPDAWPKSGGYGRRTQETWVLVRPKKLESSSGPKSVGSRHMTQKSWFLVRTQESWVWTHNLTEVAPTHDPRELGETTCKTQY
jgi:hypothetical protein